MVVLRRDDVTTLEVMSRDPLPLRVLLGTCGPRVEEIVHALESSASLSRHFLVLVLERIL